MDALDLSPAAWILLENNNADALYYLALQFGVGGLGGYRLADTDEKKRTIVRSALKLRRHHGTRYAIREALRAIGFQSIEIIEAAEHNALLPYKYDGTRIHDGSFTYGSLWHWGQFGVYILPHADNPVITADNMELARELVNYWKPARCELVAFGVRLPLTEGGTIDDSGLTVT